MAWVKRNLIFVITIAVGLIATGYCGYLLYAALGANAAVNSDYSSTVDQFNTLQKATPPATKENIQAAKADQERVRQFLADFRKAFAPFPTAPPVDDRGFVEHLQRTLREFGIEATNAGVQLPPDYGFSFSLQKQKMSFSSECIDPWMQELEQIKLILHVLFVAKINFLEQIQRVPACSDDVSGDDCLGTTVQSNLWGVVTPYKVTFRGFSTELASVLSGFADSSNCFIVKYIDIKPSRAPLPTVIAPPPPQMAFMPPPQYVPYGSDNPYRPYGGERGPGRGYPPRGIPRPQEPLILPTPSGPAPPETILQETPLYITLVVDAVNLKMPEH